MKVYKSKRERRIRWLQVINHRKPTIPWAIGEKRLNSSGYYLVKTPSGVIPEHRLIISEQLGRELESSEAIHHRNHIKTDNNVENLELMPVIEHNRLHLGYIKAILCAQ